MTAQVEEDRWGLAAVARLDRFVDDGADRMGALRRGNGPLGPSELQGRVEAGRWWVGDRLDVAVIHQRRHERRHPVVTEAAGMDALRNEAVAESVHLHQRRHLPRVAKVVGVLAARNRRAGLWLRGEEAGLGLALQPVAQERERQAGEVAAAADTANAADGHRLPAPPLPRPLPT